MSQVNNLQHEAISAACEVVRTVTLRRKDGVMVRVNRVVPYGSIATPSAYHMMQTVYRMHGTDTTNPTRLLEWYYEAKQTWVSAPKRLQREPLECMVRRARSNPTYFRVVVYDYAGRRIIVDHMNAEVRGDKP